MTGRLVCFAQARSKAIAGGAAAVVAWAANTYGWKLPVGWEAALQAGLPALLIYLAPKNQECA
ncbi:MAG TPA: hypothetical protein VGR13_03415 [Actinomycetota bacterium]|jgi:hypothetical protein|nr:hypothetical protein [Actinomycetota bacterium]